MLAGHLSTVPSASSPLSRRKHGHSRALVITHAQPVLPKDAAYAAICGRRGLLAGLTGVVSAVVWSSNARADSGAANTEAASTASAAPSPAPNPDPTSAPPTLPASEIPPILTAEPSNSSSASASDVQSSQTPASGTSGPSTPPSTAATPSGTPAPLQQSPADAPAASSSKEISGTKDINLSDETALRMLQEEEGKRKQRKRKNGRIRELEEVRSELAEKELILLTKEQELLDRDQTLAVLKEELELERKLRALLTKEKEKAEEEAALAMGLCTGGAMLP